MYELYIYAILRQVIPVRILNPVPTIQVTSSRIREIPEITATLHYPDKPKGRPLRIPLKTYQSCAKQSQSADTSQAQQGKQQAPADEKAPREPPTRYSLWPDVSVPPKYR